MTTPNTNSDAVNIAIPDDANLFDNVDTDFDASRPLTVDTDFDDVDQGYVTSTSTSYLSSVASNIRKGVVEKGHVYPDYGKNPYGLPMDAAELDRNDMQHAKFTMLHGRRLHLAPISKSPHEILDLGTGTGIWAMEMADFYLLPE